MQTKVKATVYAAKLRARLKELKQDREKAIKQFDRDLEQWHANLVSWIRANGFARVTVISRAWVCAETRSRASASQLRLTE